MNNLNERNIDSIKIVEYDNLYAKSIAKMWDMSGEFWGGGNAAPTEADIIEEHDNTDNLNIYLAIDNDEVVGYCSFGEYKLDQGALYIPLLNVRPDYHGKKVGKMLVLKALERTIELGWPRLDLFTWAGNTKAVPLYKKTGFFWEKRDDSSHLMNFIPTVLNTEPLKEYFTGMDWYKDSIRPIEIKPDGSEEMDYSNYEYLWEKNDKRVKVEFERRGRGLRLIETPDYLIEAKLEDYKLIFGNEYEIKYNIVNKTGKPLKVTLQGVNDKNIKFSMEAEIDVETKHTIVGMFEVEEIEEEQNSFKTHPAVIADVTINGKKTVLKVGIEPQFPAKISIATRSSENYINGQSEFFLNLQNNFNEDVVFQLVLPKSENVEFSKSELKINMKAKERKSITIPYILRKPCIYSAKVDIKAITCNSTVSFSKQLAGVFKGNTGAFGGETEDYWMVCNGKYTLKLTKFDNDVEINNFERKDFETFLMSPKIGMPLSSEFSKIKPHKVEYIAKDNDIILKAQYLSKDFKDIQLTQFFSLSPNGIVKHYHEITNLGDRKTEKEMWIRRTFYHNLANAYMPCGDEIVYNPGGHATAIDFWESSRLSENWIFSKDQNITRGICWSNNSKVKFMGWPMVIDDNVGIIDSKETIVIEPMYIAIDSYDNYKEFRSFALQTNNNEELKLVEKFDVSINNGNPFVGDSFDIQVKNHHKIHFSGDVSFQSMMQGLPKTAKSFTRDEEIREHTFRISNHTLPKIDIVEIDADFEDISLKRKAIVFRNNGHRAAMEMKQDSGMEALTINNGSIVMKASPEFGPCLYSLTYKGKEWLHSSFPTPKPFSWWNPWTGGIICRPQNMQLASVADEKSTAEFVELRDNYNNLWQGIKVTVTVEKHEDYKGLEINQYFMTIGDLPIILTTTEVLQNTGCFFDLNRFQVDLFIKPEEKLNDNCFASINSNGDLVKYKGGKRCDIKDGHMLAFEGRSIKDKLVIYNTSEKVLMGFANNLTLGGMIFNNVSCQSGDKITTPPTFLLFNEDYLDEKLIKDLKNIKLSI